MGRRKGHESVCAVLQPSQIPWPSCPGSPGRCVCRVRPLSEHAISQNAVVLAPVAEEFIFRGLLYPFIKQLGWPRLALIGVNLLFALIHFDVATFLALFLLALALTWLYEKTDNLLAPIAVHSLFNATNLGMLVLKHFYGVPQAT